MGWHLVTLTETLDVEEVKNAEASNHRRLASGDNGPIWLDVTAVAGGGIIMDSGGPAVVMRPCGAVTA